MTTLKNLSAAERFGEFLDAISRRLEGYMAFRAFLPKLRVLSDQCKTPFNLAVVGRMKTGKSTLINSIIGQPLAISDVEEATATINWIRYGQDSNHFEVHYKNGLFERLPCERIADFTGKDEATLEKIQQVALLQFFAPVKSLKAVQIVDTPGTGSARQEHQEVTSEFLDPEKLLSSVAEGSKADAIIYVVGSAGRTSDVENLDLFAKGRSSNCGPFNSVCVLHKWDGLEEKDPLLNAGEKASLLHSQIKDSVIDVIPVSGPLALLSRYASDSFFSGLLAILSSLDAESLENCLKRDSRWDKDENRASIRTSVAGYLPWVSFVLTCRVLVGQKAANAAQARQYIGTYSQIGKLEQVLKEKFFSRTGIVKSLSILQRSVSVVEPMLREMQTVIAERQEVLRILTDELRGTSRGESWLQSERKKVQQEISDLKSFHLEIDREWLLQKERLELLNMDINALGYAESNPTKFTSEEKQAITIICNFLANQNMNELPVTESPIGQYIDKYRSYANRSRGREARIYQHLVTRMEQIILR